MTAHVPEIASFNVIKGFLNLSLDGAFWAARFEEIAADDHFGQAAPTGRTVMIEYSSPNTNKPLHLGHIRNNLRAHVAQILAANGHTVIKGQPGERPRHPYLQVDAGVETLRRRRDPPLRRA